MLSSMVHTVEAELQWFDLIRSLKDHERRWLFTGERELILHDQYEAGLVSKDEVLNEIRDCANA